MTQAKQWRSSRSTPALLELPGGGTPPSKVSLPCHWTFLAICKCPGHPSQCLLSPTSHFLIRNSSHTGGGLFPWCARLGPTTWPLNTPCPLRMSCLLPQPPLLQISKNTLNSRFKFLHLREASRTAQSKIAAPPCPSLSQQPYFITSLACLTLWPYCLYCFSALYSSPSLRGELIRMGSLSCALLPSQSLESCLGCNRCSVNTYLRRANTANISSFVPQW